MTINSAINFFESLKKQTQNKSELKIYKEFTGILSALENRDLSDKELQSIEKTLTNLNLTANNENQKKHFKRKLGEFKKQLKEEFSFVIKGYYSGIGTSLGMVFGMAIGPSVFGAESGVATGMMFGMFIGLILGRYKDSEAEKENRVLKSSTT